MKPPPHSSSAGNEAQEIERGFEMRELIAYFLRLGTFGFGGPDLWSGWQRVNGMSRISQAGEMHGISDIGSGRLFIIKPYGLLGFQHLPESVAGTGLNPGWSCQCTGGVDVKVGLRTNLVANATVNTDFADANVDLQNFNLTPYPLYYPETRQFFLENAGIFNFPLGGDSGDLLFFSRQIGIDPVTGQEVPIRTCVDAGGLARLLLPREYCAWNWDLRPSQNTWPAEPVEGDVCHVQQSGPRD
jgi:hypothetical protein